MKLDELKKWLNDKLIIHPDNLDLEALKTPQIHGEVMNIYSSESLKLKELIRKQKIVKLQRWKYYSGKQTPSYYKEHGQIKEIINKTDVHNYMEADVILNSIEKLLEEQKIKVEILENSLKQINQRPFLIKDAIQWRMYINGS